MVPTPPTLSVTSHGDCYKPGWCLLGGLSDDFHLALATVHHSLDVDKDGGVFLAKTLSSLIDCWDGDRLCIDVNLLPAVRVLANRFGWGFKSEISESAPLGPADIRSAAAFGHPDRGLLELLETAGRGLVRCDPAVDRTRLAAEIAAAFPIHRILIVGSTKKECRHTFELLRAANIDAEWIRSGQGCRSPAPRVVVATPVQAPTFGNFADVDLYIALDALAALGANYGLDPSPRLLGLDAKGLAVAKRRPPEQSFDPTAPTRPSLKRRLALIATDAVVTPAQAARLRRAFGFFETTAFPHAHEPPRVDLDWIPLRRCAARSAPTSERERCRQLWSDPVRNRRLVTAARKAADQGDRVLVYCATVEQAAAFAKALPGWNIRLDRAVDLAGLNHADRRVLQRACPKARGPLLFSTAFAARPDSCSPLDPSDFNVVIRAAGGTGLIPLLAAPPGVPSARGHRVRLVDVDDRWSPTARQASRARRAAYIAAGWFSLGADPVTCRAADFVELCRTRYFEFARQHGVPT